LTYTSVTLKFAFIAPPEIIRYLRNYHIHKSFLKHTTTLITTPSVSFAVESITTHNLISITPRICRQLKNQGSIALLFKTHHSSLTSDKIGHHVLYLTTLSSFTSKEGQLLIPNFFLYIFTNLFSIFKAKLHIIIILAPFRFNYVYVHKQLVPIF